MAALQPISLTDFIKVVLKSGTPKATKVKQIKKRPPYSPGGDYYRGLREKIVETHSSGLDKNNLDDAVRYAHKKRKGHYQQAVSGYKKWWGNREFEWFDPPKSHYKGSIVSVSINPELGLSDGDTEYVIKLYFKTDKLLKNRAVHVYQMMEECGYPLNSA